MFLRLSTMKNIVYFQLLISTLLLSSFCPSVVAIKEDSNRVFTAEELAKFTGGEDKQGEIYLSVLGEVYNVTSGDEFYAVGAGYSFFAARDATICFFTGEYNVEHINDKKVMDFSGSEIVAMDEWRMFYEEHENYTFLGVLVGDYYDSEGKETPYLVKIREAIKITKEEIRERERLNQEDQRRRREERLAKQSAEKSLSDEKNDPEL